MFEKGAERKLMGGGGEEEGRRRRRLRDCLEVDLAAIKNMKGGVRRMD